MSSRSRYREAFLMLMARQGRLVVCMVLLTSLALRAQVGAGSIQGTVTDSSGAVIPNATIVAEHLETANTFRTLTNNVGFFLFPSAQHGKYRVTVESAGLEK